MLDSAPLLVLQRIYEALPDLESHRALSMVCVQCAAAGRTVLRRALERWPPEWLVKVAEELQVTPSEVLCDKVPRPRVKRRWSDKASPQAARWALLLRLWPWSDPSSDPSSSPPPLPPAVLASLCLRRDDRRLAVDAVHRDRHARIERPDGSTTWMLEARDAAASAGRADVLTMLLNEAPEPTQQQLDEMLVWARLPGHLSSAHFDEHVVTVRLLEDRGAVAPTPRPPVRVKKPKRTVQKSDLVEAASYESGWGRLCEMLKNGADPNEALKSSGRTALSAVLESRTYKYCCDLADKVRTVNVLLQHGADPCIGPYPPVFSAVYYDLKLSLAEILNHCPAAVNVQPDGDRCGGPLFSSKNAEMTAMLLRFGADPNSVGKHFEFDKRRRKRFVGNTTPLCAACAASDTDRAALLLLSGAEVNPVDVYASPLTLASRAGYVDLVHLLLNAGADVNRARAELCGERESRCLDVALRSRGSRSCDVP